MKKEKIFRENQFVFRMPFIPGRKDLKPTLTPETSASTDMPDAKTTALNALTKNWVDLRLFSFLDFFSTCIKTEISVMITFGIVGFTALACYACFRAWGYFDAREQNQQLERDREFHLSSFVMHMLIFFYFNHYFSTDDTNV